MLQGKKQGRATKTDASSQNRTTKRLLSGLGLGLPTPPDRFLHSEVTPDNMPPATKWGEQEGKEGEKEGRRANQGSFELTLMSMFRFPSTICAPLKRLALSATT